MSQFGRDSRKPRSKRVPRIASTTAAIRSALALSAAVLALSGTGVAYAGTCVTDAGAATPTISCNGFFTDTVNNSIDPTEIVADLTLVLGDEAVTSVSPPLFGVGVIGNWDGAVGITSRAVISTFDAYAVLAYGDTVTVDNQGYMAAGAMYHFGAETIHVQAQYDAEVHNSGIVYAFAPGSTTAVDESSVDGSVSLDNHAGGMIYAIGSGATGAELFAGIGEVEIDNAGTIGAIGYFGAEGVYARGPSGISLENSGKIEAQSVYGYATAVDLTAFSGEIHVDNSGTLSASSHTSLAAAIQAYNGGDGTATILNSGSISAESSFGIALGVYAHSHGDMAFYNSATGIVSAESLWRDAQGVRVVSVYGTVDVDNDGAIYAHGGNYNRSLGVWAEARGGNEYLDNSGTIASSAMSSAVGFYAFLSKSEALIDFHNSGEIDALSYGSAATGVYLLGSTWDATIQADNDGTITATSYGAYQWATGIKARGSFTGTDVYVSDGAYGEIVARGARGAGVFAGAYSANIGIDNDGSISAYGVYNAVGVYGVTGGTSGDADLQNSGSIHAAAYYGNAYGVLLRAYNGTTSLDSAIDGSISAASAYAVAIGAEVKGLYASATNHGTISAVGSVGAAGLTTEASHGSAELENWGSIVANGDWANGAQVASNYGDASFENTGTITAIGGSYAAGARAVSVYGTVTAINSDAISASADERAWGMIALGNDVYVYNTGDISAAGYFGNAYGIHSSARGTLLVHNYGDVDADSVQGRAEGISVDSFAAHAEATVGNAGSIDASSRYGVAYGVLERVQYGSASLDNAADGAIAASSDWSMAFGAELVGYQASVVNHGTISAVADNALAEGLLVYASDWVASLRNSGSISASGDQAIGAQLVGVRGSAGLVNGGTIDAEGTGAATAVRMSAENGMLIASNFGTISASADGSAQGLSASGGFYNYVYNEGDIVASAQYGTAVALRIDGYGLTLVDNDGHVEATSVSRSARALFVDDYSLFAQVLVDNSGDVIASSTTNLATGITAKAWHYGDAEVISSGDILVHAGTTANGILGYVYDFADISVITTAGEIVAEGGSGNGRGILARAFGSGDAIVDNGADIDASGNAFAQGLNVRSFGGDVSASNSGALNVTGVTQADGILAASTYGDVYALNSGEIVATGGEFAQGMHLRDVDGNISAVNHGDIRAYAGLQSANGIFMLGTGTSDLYVFNDGDILANGDSYALGLNLHTECGDIVAANAGHLTAEADAETAVGIQARITGAGDVAIGNEGTINAASGGNSYGIYAYTLLGDIGVDNRGDIYASGEALVVGMELKATGDIVVDSSGSIHASGINTAWGIEVITIDSGDVSITNDGSIDAQAIDRNAVGVHSSGLAGDFHLYNNGPLTAASVNGDAMGVYIDLGTDGAQASVSNGGTIGATSEFANAIGIHLEGGWEYNLLAVDSDGAISAEAYHGRATGVSADAYGYQGQASVDIGDDGSVHAASGYVAYGVIAAAGKYAELTNAGDIDVVASNEAHRYAYAAGAVVATDYGQALIGNSGSISALAEGLASRASGATVSGNGANVALANAGTLSATANGEHAANATGAIAESVLLSAFVENSGTIQALASADLADAIGAFAHASESAAIGTVAGSALQAIAVGDSDADATGAFALGLFANIYGDGVISAEASASLVDGDARAYGANAYGNFTGIYVLGDGSATASAEGAYALAVGALQDGYFTAFRNEGTIAATASGADGAAIGAMTLSGYGVHLYNEGQISATAHGDEVLAAGLFATAGYGSLELDNAGAITASGDSLSVAVQLRTDFATHIENSGTLDALVAIYTSGLSEDEIHNTGLINGAIWSGAGDDTLFNDEDAVWNAGYISDFGAGDDHISNIGTIKLAGAGLLLGDGDDVFDNDGGLTVAGSLIDFGDGDDHITNSTTITVAGSELLLGAGNDAFDIEGTLTLAGSLMDLGDGDDHLVNSGTINLVASLVDFGPADADGNAFYNYGVLRVRGHSEIDMGGGGMATLLPAVDPDTFYNGGVIDFQDGAPDDVLVITGDFDGDGELNVDLSGLQGASDMLYIDGDVASGSVTTINIDVLDMPEELQALVPIVNVSGAWTADNFVLGDLDVPFDATNSFVTLDVDLAADGENLALAFEVTGLTDAGTVATTVAPAVQGLMSAQVGTWRQRMGVIDRFTGRAVALWARVFQDKGGFSPEHREANFGSGGNFDWDQKNSGVEAGLDFAVTDEFSLGLLVGKSEADTHLENDAAATSDIDADTWGLYGTWLSPTGFYLDASYRWMSFDVDLRSVAGAMEADGDAESLNLELGYAWTLSGGLKIEPQLQYTRTSVDELDVFETSSGMSFRNEGGESSRGRLGVALRKGFGEADAGWQWTPYAALSVVREFDGENLYAINDVFHGETDLEGTSTLLELGFSARHQNWSVYGGLNWQDGGAVENFFGGQLGVRYTFGPASP